MTSAPSADREVRATVVNDTTGAIEANVKLEIPAGWTATPPQQTVGPSNSTPGEQSQVPTDGPGTSPASVELMVA